MMSLIEQVKQTTQIRWNGVHKFKPKILMAIEVGPYLIKTAETPSELKESFKLRHEVFHNEFRGVKGSGLDCDKYDFFFDHLIIVHKLTQKIIGTYRLNCSSFSRESYTATEFNISRLFLLPGPHLELGRACIHRDFRKGAVISMLWKGIAEYMSLSGSKILFGCSSLKLNHPREAALVYTHLLNQGQVSTHFPFHPTKNYEMKNFDSWLACFGHGLSEDLVSEAESLIPSLLKSYLKLGAKIGGYPAFDKEFGCIDMLTVLKRENLSTMAERFC